MTHFLAVRLAAVLGFLGVALGAFGAHALKDLLIRNQTAPIWDKAVFYHLVHAVVLLVLAGRNPVPTGPCLSFLTGVLLFSGSLYILAVTNVRWLGAITPFGGVAFLVGWLWLMVAAASKNSS